MTALKFHIVRSRGVWHLQPGRLRHSIYWSRNFRAVCEVAKILGSVPPLPKQKEAP